VESCTASLDRQLLFFPCPTDRSQSHSLASLSKPSSAHLPDFTVLLVRFFVQLIRACRPTILVLSPLSTVQILKLGISELLKNPKLNVELLTHRIFKIIMRTLQSKLYYHKKQKTLYEFSGLKSKSLKRRSDQRYARFSIIGM